MEFNKIILNRLNPLFLENGFDLIVESNYEIAYGSSDFIVTLVHNVLENSNSLWVERKNSLRIEIDDQIINGQFGSDLKLNKLSPEAFAENVSRFLNGVGKNILLEPEIEVKRLEEFNRNRSSKYTKHLVQEQWLNAANKAWDEGNYIEVIRILNNLNMEDFPISLKKKYELAKKRLKR